MTTIKLTCDLFNTIGENDINYGWVGINCDRETDEQSGGWFFETPASLVENYGVISGEISEDDIAAAIASMEADEMAPPVGLDESEAEGLIRRRLEKFLA